jgi:NAD(P) transhydrogenase subunit alpha
LWGGKDVPSQLPFHASQLFSRNCLNLLMLMIKTEEGNTSIALDFEDEIIAGSAITHAGEIRHEGARNAITGAGKN